MSDNKFESFKVADKHRPRVSGKKAGHAPEVAAALEQPQTLGFARIEAILDHEDPKQVHHSLNGLIEALDGVSSGAGAQKERGQAKRAKQAVEHTLELLTYLFHTKNDMLQSLAGGATPPEAGKGKGRSAPRKGIR